MRTHRAALLTLVCLGTVFVSGCGSTEVERQETNRVVHRAALIDELYSFESPNEVRDRLDASLLPWKVVEDSALAPGDRRPPFHQYVVAVDGYTHIDTSGELQLCFFNGRLMATYFFPSDPEAYLRHLRVSRGIDFTGVREASLSQYTRVSTGSIDGRTYVAWEDARLSEEFDDWIRRYS